MNIYFRKAILLVLLILGLGVAFAQTTGKIKGRVKDESGDPLPGAFVTIVGTTMGAQTDDMGYYYIIGVRAGTYDLKCQFVGYKTAEKKGVSVKVGLTATVDFKMTTGDTEMKEMSVMEERVDKVEKSKTSSERSINLDVYRGRSSSSSSSSSAKKETPPPPPASSAPDVDASLSKMAGVKKEASGELHFRGGRDGESDTPPPPPPPASSAHEEEAVDSYMVKDVKPREVKVKIPTPIAKPTSAGLKAGYSDDNKQFNYFIDFLKKYKNVQHINIPVEERFVLKVTDVNNKPVSSAVVTISDNNRVLTTGLTHADGSYYFFPAEFGPIQYYQVNIKYEQINQTVNFSRQDKRIQEIKLQTTRKTYQQVPLDILFIFDTTGSMSEEIQRLKKTIELINLNLAELPSRPLVRFGMVLYRDKGDNYVTKIVPLTADLDEFNKELQQVSADGGGDTPEDLNSALDDAMNNIKWNPDGVKMAFVITDANIHLDYKQKYSYNSAVKDAKANGIKIFTVGTGGLDIKGEFVLRQISQYTAGKYIFLTYGEKGESAGGTVGAVSHHSGDNFQTDKLEAVIIKFTKEELEYFRDSPSEVAEDFFKAVKTPETDASATLEELFGKALGQLTDFSTINLPAKMPAAILPFQLTDTRNAVTAEYLAERLGRTVLKNPRFTLVDRASINKIVEEIGLQQTGLTTESNLTKAGKLLGADYLLTGKLFAKEGFYELYLRLVRVESGEILAVTKTEIDELLLR